MKFNLQRVLSAVLSAVLLLVFVMPPVSAAADQEASVPEESLLESVPEESTRAATSEPEEETAPSTDPAESTAATTAPTETTTETAAPAEITADTQPAETEPALTEPTLEPEETTEVTELTEPTEETVAEELSEEESPELDWNLYFGQLHAHTDLSDGLGSVREAFQYAVQVENLDFFAVTDHSDSFDGSDFGVITEDGSAVSREWAQGKAAAAAVTGESFVGIFGYEMSWQEGRHLGHLNTFGTPGFVSRDQEPFVHSLEAYYRALGEVPGSVSQFNHPGHQYGDFENFGHYSARADARICLLEVCSGDGFSAYEAYPRALDAGWHVAPTTSQNNHNGFWGDAREDRTVVLAGELTEEALYEAMRSCRVYATADGDLTVYYQLNGHIMGSILGDVDRPEISVYLHDPTDGQIGQVDVLVDGGRVAASAWVDGAEETVELYPAGGYSYYYLRITQPDGDIAVTAPVWTDSYDEMGIADFRADTETPIRGQPMELSVALYNDESIPCQIEKLEWSAGGEQSSLEIDRTLQPRDYQNFAIPFTHEGLGTADVQLKVTASAAGETRVWRDSLTLQVLPEELVTGILVDGSHGNRTDLNNFKTLAAGARMDVHVFDGPLPEGGEILLVGPPETPFEAEFLTRTAAFMETGGSLILWGGADEFVQLNNLLEAVGSTMRLGGDVVQVDSAAWNEEFHWCSSLTSAQIYTQPEGCTVDPGRGTWLVKAEGGRVLLACENTPWGGTILAAGGAFLSDESMPLPGNKWAAPRVGQSILEQLLDLEQPRLPMSTVADLRQGEPGQIFRVRGYVTAGTANPYNRFPETIYLQSDEGGIALKPFREEGIQVGTPMDVTGYLDEENGMPVLRWIDYDLPDEGFYRHVPRTVRCETAMDYEKNGGMLMQVEGEATSVTVTEDGKGVARLTIRDFMGDKAEILIEDCIRSGASGKNDLAAEIKKGRMVRAMGIVHLDEGGKPVLRVRNCEEVVYIPPRRYPSDNPKTGDLIWISPIAAAVSLAGLEKMRKKRKMK